METEPTEQIDQLVARFAECVRKGSPPSIEEFIQQNPHHSMVLKKLLPSVLLVEQIAKQATNSTVSGEYESDLQSISQLPKTFGDFEILREIGRGGMGIVYVAFQKSLKRKIALKTLTQQQPSQKSRARFKREAESAASLHHTNIIPVFGIGEEEGILFYAMQLIDGVPLSSVIDSLRLRYFGESRENAHTAATDAVVGFSAEQAVNQLLDGTPTKFKPEALAVTDSIATHDSKLASTVPLPTQVSAPTAYTDDATIEQTDPIQGETTSKLREGEVSLGHNYYKNIAKLIASVANALQYAHHQGILHRDMKPGNLLLDRDNTIWISDFGLARPIDFSGVTQTGEIVGTLRFMAPEQFKGASDCRTDIYSLGLTLYELLTLRPAVEFKDGRLIYRNTGEGALHPEFGKSSVPNDLQTICLKACSRDPMQRYQHAGELEEDLRRFLDDRPILARRSTTYERLVRWSRRNPALAGLLSLTALLLVSVAAILAISNQQKQKSLVEIEKLFRTAEQSVEQTKDALETARQEKERAEKNLALALEAFDNIVSNIASRGTTASAMVEIGQEEEMLEFSDAALSSADIQLMETLLVFFDRFAEQNGADLKLQSAIASRRVGDIQSQLGRTEDAERSYRKALEYYNSANVDQQHNEANDLAQVEVLTQLISVLARKGDMLATINLFQRARRILDNNSNLKQSHQGRYALAMLLNNMVSVGTRTVMDPRSRARLPAMGQGRLPQGMPNSPAGSPSLAQTARQRLELEANKEARGLLLSLIEEKPQEQAYQIALAQNYRDEVRLARGSRDPAAADDSLRKAIELLEGLVEKYPDSLVIQYQLAEILSTPMPGRLGDGQRLVRALAICDQLIAAQPNVPEYKALRGNILVRQAVIMIGSGRRDRGDEILATAIEYQRGLADQFPDSMMYQGMYLNSLQMHASMLADQGKKEEALQNIDKALLILENIRKSRRQPMLLQTNWNRLNDLRKSLDENDKK
jgi:serine/threonine protein kinase